VTTQTEAAKHPAEETLEVLVRHFSLVGLGLLATAPVEAPKAKAGQSKTRRVILAELGKTIGVALREMPILLALVFFFFITEDTWKVLTPGSPLDYFLMLAVFLAGLGILLWWGPRTACDEVVAFARGGKADQLTEALSTKGSVDSRRALDLIGEVQLDEKTRPVPGGLAGRVRIIIGFRVARHALGVAGAVFAAFMLFGFVAIDAGLTATWSDNPVGSPLVHLGSGADSHVLTWQLLAVSSLLAVFSALVFAANVLRVDQALRKEFIDEPVLSLKATMAAWVYYDAAKTKSAPPPTCAP
jgi:hypothetical protein